MKPLIGIECDVDRGSKGEFAKLYPRYWNAVERAGGLPILIPFTDDRKNLRSILDHVDGLLLPGGDDLVPPDGATPEITPASPRRTSFCRRLICEAEDRDLPTLAICLGMQILCDVFGAQVAYHIPHDVPNSMDHSDSVHLVEVEHGSLLARAIGASGSIRTSSAHHQGIVSVSPFFRAVAHAADGVIEAVELRTCSWFVGVQWHPELIPPDPRMEGLFLAHCRAASKRALSSEG